jgi:polysaccharide biosynthesis transport protein
MPHLGRQGAQVNSFEYGFGDGRWTRTYAVDEACLWRENTRANGFDIFAYVSRVSNLVRSEDLTTRALRAGALRVGQRRDEGCCGRESLQMAELTLKDIFRIVLRKIQWILLAAVLVTAAVWFYNNTLPDVYTAEASLYVLMGYTDSTGTIRYDVTTSNSFAGDFKELIKTPQVLEATSKALGVDKLPKGAGVDIESVAGTRIIKILTTYTDPAESMRITNTIASVFASYVSKLTKTESISIASDAILPTVPSGPRRLVSTLIAFFVTVFLGMMTTITVSVLDTKVRSDQVITEKLNLNVLAQVQDYTSVIDKFKRQPRTGGRILYDCLEDNIREQIKRLSLNMRFAAMDEPLRSIMVVSTSAQEGKSSLSTMLASQMGEDGKRIVMIDLDFRHPTLGKYVGVRGKYDLLSYFEEKCSINQLIIKTPIPNVYVIDSRQRSSLPTRIFESKKFDDLLEQLYKAFDTVIIDSPPIGLFVDGAVLSTKASGVVLVVADGRVDIKNLSDTVSQLRRGNANLLGCVLNLISKRNMKSRYSHYNSYSKYTKNE